MPRQQPIEFEEIEFEEVAPTQKAATTPTVEPIDFEEIDFEEVPSTTPGKDERTPMRVWGDQVINFGKGVGDTVLAIPQAIYQAGKVGLGYGPTGNPAQDVLNFAKSVPEAIVEGVRKPVATMGRNALAYAESLGILPPGTVDAPTPEETGESARFAGQFVTGIETANAVGNLTRNQAARTAGRHTLQFLKDPPAEVKKALTRPAQAALIDAASPGGSINFVDAVPGLLDEVKMSKKLVEDVDGILSAIDERTTYNLKEVDALVKDQLDIVLPDTYRQQIIKAQVAAIPDDVWDQMSQAQQRGLLEQITQSVPEKLTIGDLNKRRKELNATLSPYYGKDIMGQLTMDAGKRSVDVARGNAIRNAFYDALDNEGLGGGAAVREYNRRIGDLLHGQRVFEHRRNPAAAQELSPFGELMRKIPQGIASRTPGIRGMAAARGLGAGTDKINTLIRNSIRDWTGSPAAVPVDRRTQRLRPNTLAGAQPEFPGIQSAATPPSTAPLLAPPPVSAGELPSPIQEAVGAVQTRAYNEARRNVPTLAGDVVDLFPSAEGANEGMLVNARRFRSNIGPRGLGGQNPTADYLDQLSKRRIWEAAQRLGVAGGEVPPKPPAGTQGSLMRGMEPEAAPRSTMGIGQTPEPPARFRPIARDTYTMQDLRQMVDEFAQFIGRYPNHPEVQALRRDMQMVQDELTRRNLARR